MIRVIDMAHYDFSERINVEQEIWERKVAEEYKWVDKNGNKHDMWDVSKDYLSSLIEFLEGKELRKGKLEEAKEVWKERFN